jgi:hypothetical protein
MCVLVLTTKSQNLALQAKFAIQFETNLNNGNTVIEKKIAVERVGKPETLAVT